MLILPVERFKDREDLYRGPLACTTPGNLAGWCTLVERYGKKSLKEVFQPAIEFARDGVVLTDFNEEMYMEAAQDLKPHRAFYEDWNRTYAFGKGKVKAGQVLKQHELAKTYQAIVTNGLDHLYKGALGKALLAQVKKLGSCLAQDDFDAVEPEWLEPVAGEYRDIMVHTLPPPCEGFQLRH